jgi:hypothetical protein
MAKSKLQQRKDNPRSKYWLNKADALWGKVIHEIYPRCAMGYEDCAGGVEAHHLIGRANRATRHSIENGIGLCCKHHKWDNRLSAHGAPLAFAEWLQVTFPDRWEWSSRNKNAMGKADYQMAYEHLVKWCEVNNAEHLLRG